MSEAQYSSNNVTCSSASTSEVSTSKATVVEEGKEETNSEQIQRFCVNEIPWKLVPQQCDENYVYEYLDEKDRRISDVESFVWKWSPCGRYGIDLPGGRENILDQLNDRMAIFDLHKNKWSLYTMDAHHFEIPRVCFLYWARNDIIGTVSLVKDYEPGADDEIQMKFKQSFYYISHESRTLIHAGSCKYRTDKTIVASYWYHIFENRRGEPFADHNNQLWLVFSNGADSLILLPFIPTTTCFKAKCVSFDMNEIVSQLVGSKVYLDPFMSSHYVPFVYRNDINFFIRIDSFSFIEEGARDYSLDPQIENTGTEELQGVFHIRINLKNVIEQGEKEAELQMIDPEAIEARFTIKDVELWRKISKDFQNAHQCFSQHGKTVVLQRWSHFTIDMILSKKFTTRIADLDARVECCTPAPREMTFCAIDLDNEKIRRFNPLLLGTDVVLPHPTGSMFLFRYKEDYGMSFCELPYFSPLSLKLKCLQVLSGCVNIDPSYYSTKCILKIEEEQEQD
ncbi:unnamed protein product [Caenorhabditis brenneri]